MGKNSFWSGLVLGSLLSFSLFLLTKQIAESSGDSKKKSSQGTKSFSYKQGDLLKNISKQENNSENQSENDQGDKLQQSNVQVNPASSEDQEKEKSSPAEVRNPKAEVQKKAQQEGQQNAGISDKINFGKKISQLEEALQKLREDNTK